MHRYYVDAEIVRLRRKNQELNRQVDELLTVLIVVTMLLFVMVVVALYASGGI